MGSNNVIYFFVWYTPYLTKHSRVCLHKCLQRHSSREMDVSTQPAHEEYVYIIEATKIYMSAVARDSFGTCL